MSFILLGILNSQVSAAGGGSDTAFYAGGGGYSGTSNVIDYWNIDTLGNATDFGDLAEPTGELGSCASTTRGVIFGGYGATTDAPLNTIQYITLASTSNTTDFGDLTTAARYFPAGFNSPTRGVRVGGYTTTQLNVIDYITIATTGNATDFGDTNVANIWLAGHGNSSATRGVYGATTYEYVTIATTGNGAAFGSPLIATNYRTGHGSSTRGLIAGGDGGDYGRYDIEYITIATLGNGTDFGDLIQNGIAKVSASTPTRCTFEGGYRGVPGVAGGPFYYNTIEYVTIDSLGNGTDFGDLTVARGFGDGTSGGNGGAVG